MSLVRTVRDQVSEGCLVARCRKEGCSISLREVPAARLIIDCDHQDAPLDRNRKHCDYLFFADATDGADWIIPMEFKGGQVKVGSTVRQLQAGARTIERLVPQHKEVRFRPTAVHKGIHSQQRRQLKRRPVHFHGRSVIVRLLPCGARLVRVLTS